MKKHLIAAAVAAAVAVPAAAQVTVYGVIDQAFGVQDNGATASATVEPSTVTNFQSLLATQRLGFRGSEDLGGGLKANFVIEGGLQQGTGSASTARYQRWTRATYVELEGGFGKVQLGWMDLGTTNIDDAVSQAGNLGAMFTQADAGDITNATGNGDGLGNDNANGINFITPSFNGVTVEFGYKPRHLIAAESSGVASKAQGANAATQESQMGVRVDYRNGPLLVAVGRTQGDSEDGPTFDRKLTALGVSYNAGVVSVGFARVEAEPSSTVEHEYNLLSAAVPMGNGLALHGVYQTAKANGANEKATGYTLAVTKALSKRTTAYAAYSDLDNKGANAGYSMRGTGSASAVNTDPSAFAVGIRHSF
ncbi:OmpC Outer membrane protein (porin) [Burkholderiales bacterium]